MTAEEAIAYIHSNRGAEAAPGLARMRRLLARLGDPQERLQCIHVAGTNGKGSVCAMLESILRCAGYRTGLFTSPYIRRFQERIRIGNEQIPDEVLASLTEEVKHHAEALGEQFHAFELISAIGFLYFAREKVDYVVLEVGLGGRLDPTNVITRPVLSVITGIDFDHMEQLGSTVEAIATEKAGIVKEHCPCLFGGSDGVACRTVAMIAEQRKAPFFTVDHTECRILEMTLEGTLLDFCNYKQLCLALLGSYQHANAATALTAVARLEEGGIAVGVDAIRRGLASVRWPCRFELMRRDPIVICDGGHNPQGIAAAVESIKLYFPGETVNILSGVMEDKDYGEMVERLKEVTNRAYTVTPQNPRALSANQYAACFAAHGIRAEAFDSVEEALHTALEDSAREGRALICLGSLYLYGSIARSLEEKTLL